MGGSWGGTTMPPGYMVDTRKTLPNGSANEHWRKFVPFPAYAEIINEYFRLFLSYNGNMLATLKHIQKHGPYYPDLSECPPPEGYKAVYRLNQRGGGLCPERSAFAALLSNVTYLGHWVVNNTVVRWDNHPAIVPQAVFMRAFNYISPVGLEGEPNLHYKRFQQYARPSKEEDRPVERPLYAGMIVAQANGEWRSVGTTWLKTLQHYIYVHCTPR